MPALSCHIQVRRDPVEGRGPLQGILVGLQALRGRADAAFVASCDTPLLRPEVVQHLGQRLQRQAVDAAVAVDGRHFHPLCAVYRVAVAGVVRQLLDESQTRPRGDF